MHRPVGKDRPWTSPHFSIWPKKNINLYTILCFLDNRILEYNFDEVLFSKPSDHQSIQIVSTKDFGRLLILNDMANLAENDKVEYTHTLMNLPNENYGVSCFLLHQFSKFNNFLWICWFLCKNLSNFVPPAWKLDNPYYHTTHIHNGATIKLI